MSFERSTNERVLARHRFKRSRYDVAIRGVNQPSSSVLDVVSSPLLSTTSTPSTPLTFPAIGTDRLALPNPSPTTSSVPVSETVPLRVISISSSVSSHSLIPPTSSSVLPSSSSTTSVYVTSSPSSMPTASHTVSSVTPARTDAVKSSSSTKSQSLSSGTVGGIVAVILVSALIAFGVFARRRAQHRRIAKRHTWSAGLVPTLETKRTTVYSGQPFVGQPIGSGTPASKRLDDAPPINLPMSELLPAHAISGLAAPASSYNPGLTVSPIVPTSLRGPPSLRSVAPSTRSESLASELSIVERTFIPSLPDELHINNGEHIRILNAYDDGWALCSNSRGEQGVVPLECLRRLTSVPTEMQLQPQSQFGSSESNGTSRRLSSLTPNTSGTY